MTSTHEGGNSRKLQVGAISREGALGILAINVNRLSTMPNGFRCRSTAKTDINMRMCSLASRRDTCVRAPALVRLRTRSQWCGVWRDYTSGFSGRLVARADRALAREVVPPPPCGHRSLAQITRFLLRGPPERPHFFSVIYQNELGGYQPRKILTMPRASLLINQPIA